MRRLLWAGAAVAVLAGLAGAPAPVLADGAPTVRSVTPQPAAAGEVVSVHGHGFGGRNLRASVDGHPAQVQRSTGSTARLVVPAQVRDFCATMSISSPGRRAASTPLLVAGHPCHVTARPAPDATVQARIGPAGGTLQAVAPGGIRLQLQIPPGAVATPTLISLTPLAQVSELPFSAGLLAGAQFAPDGLQLAAPATLIVDGLPLPTADRELLAFTYRGDGRDLHLVPRTVQSGSTATVRMTVWHFSGAGVGSGTSDDASALAHQAFADEVSRRLQQVADAQLRGEDLSHADLVPVFARWFDEAVEPDLRRGQDDPGDFVGCGAERPPGRQDCPLALALRHYLQWLQSSHLTGTEEDPQLAPRIARGRDLAASGIRAAIADSTEICIDSLEVRAATDVLWWASVARDMDLATPENGLEIHDVERNLCVKPVVTARLDEPVRVGRSSALHVRAGMSFGGAPPRYDEQLDVRVEVNRGSASPERGQTDGRGTFTGAVVPSVVPVDVTVTACHPALRGRGCTSTTVSGSGQLTMTLTGRRTYDGEDVALSPVEMILEDEVELRAELRDGGSPVPRASVTFTLLEGSGQIDFAPSTTDGDGVATARFTPDRAGTTNVVEASYLRDGRRVSTPLTIEVLPVQVHVEPAGVALAAGSSTEFTATVTGARTQTVTWTATGGTIDANGRYDAPRHAGRYEVTARSAVDPAATGVALVEVVGAGPVTIEPAEIELTPENRIWFTLSAGDEDLDEVTWSASGGSIDEDGLYVAPREAGTYTVTGTSAAGQATATVRVRTVWPSETRALAVTGCGDGSEVREEFPGPEDANSAEVRWSGTVSRGGCSSSTQFEQRWDLDAMRTHVQGRASGQSQTASLYLGQFYVPSESGQFTYSLTGQLRASDHAVASVYLTRLSPPDPPAGVAREVSGDAVQLARSGELPHGLYRLAVEVGVSGADGASHSGSYDVTLEVRAR